MRKLILSAALILPLSSIALANDDAMPEKNHPMKDATQNVKEAATKLMLTNKSFVSKAAISDRGEIELSKIAATKSSNPDVKSFAQRMITDHTSASIELKAIADSKNIEVPTELDRTHEKAIAHLSTLSGDEFDKAYKEQMKEDHDKAVALFTAASEDKSIDSEFKQFAAKLLPKLRVHQHDAQKLEAAEHSAQR